MTMNEDSPNYKELKRRLSAAEAALETLRRDQSDIYTDITGCKTAKDNLIESERRYRALFENMNAGFVLFEVVQDDEGVPIDLIIVAANKGFEATTGLNNREVIGKRLTHVLPGIENDQADWIGTYGSIALTGEARHFEQGSGLLGYYYSINAYQSGLKQCAVTFIDITDRKRAEEALKESEARLIEAQRIAKMGDFTWNVETGEVTWSNALFDLLRYEKSEKIDYARVNREIHHPDDLARVTQWLDDCVASGKAELTPNEYRIIRKDGQVIDVRTQGVIRREAGKSVKVFATIQDITERKQIEAERDETAELFQSVFNLGPVSTTLTRISDKRIIDVNEAIVRLLGYSRDELIGKPSSDFNYWADREERQQALELFLEQGELNNFEFSFRTKTGDIGEAITHAKMVEIRGESYLLSTFVDITDRKQAVEALRESEAKFTAMIQASPMPIWISTLDGEIVEANPAFLKLIGYSYAETIGSSTVKLGLIRDKARQEIMVEMEKNGGSLRNLEIDIRVRDGTTRTVLLSGENIVVNGIPYRLGINVDITERNRVQEALRLSEEKFRAIYEQSPIAIQLYDKAGKLIDANPQTLQIYGLDDKQTILGYNMWSSPFLSAENVEALKNGNSIFIPAHLDFEEVRAANLFATDKSGIIYLEMYAIPLIREQEITGYLVHMLDVTERKEMEAKLLQSQKLESIGQLAGGIAHDFNNILVPIIGYVELALMELASDDKLYANLQRVREAAERAAALTRQILAFSRKQMLKMHVLDLNIVVADFKKMIERLIGEDIELHTFLEPALYRIRADRGQIEQVLLNLAVNARDAMPTGGQLSIETSNVYLDTTYVKKYAGSQPPGHYIMLAVSDTGYGMNAEIQQHIFEPFFTTKDKGKGTGLGLATVFGIVKQHKGNIWVYSEPGNGATFKIYLPRVEDTVQISGTTVLEPVSMYGTETILVVEDEKMVRQLVCETLAAYGYQVVEAQSATDGLRLATEAKSPPNLLLTDVIMPEMNGRELYQKIAYIHPDIKVLYMSGYTDNAIVHHGILDKDINFLQKPFSVQSLTRKVKQVLG